jgi:hypothetical protein
MILRNAEPVSHVSPYKRIEIGSTPVRKASSPPELENSSLKLERDVEHRRIWRLLVQSSQDGIGTVKHEDVE